MVALLVGLALLVLLPHPWNGVGFAVAASWALVGIAFGLRWSKRGAPLVGTDALVGRQAVVIDSSRLWVLVKIQGETWKARSSVAVRPGDRVRISSVDGLTLQIEPQEM
jgi:membrane-bound serine protease (ClpP class)